MHSFYFFALSRDRVHAGSSVGRIYQIHLTVPSFTSSLCRGKDVASVPSPIFLTVGLTDRYYCSHQTHSSNRASSPATNAECPQNSRSGVKGGGVDFRSVGCCLCFHRVFLRGLGVGLMAMCLDDHVVMVRWGEGPPYRKWGLRQASQSTCLRKSCLLTSFHVLIHRFTQQRIPAL